MNDVVRAALAAVTAALLPLGHLAAQDTAAPGYVVDQWNTDNGLPQNSVNTIVQTRDGYLWLATNGGLARFDGVSFRTINSGSRTGLASDRILSLAVDAADRIWVGTEGGLSRFENNTFTTFTVADGLPGPAISSVAAHPDGSVLFGTWGGAVGRIDATGINTLVPGDGRLGDLVSRVVVDPRGDIWVWARTGVWRIDPTTHIADSIAPPRQALLSAAMNADTRAGVWVANDSGISHITRTRRLEFPIRRYLGDRGQLDDNVDVSTITAIGPDELLLGTRAGEVWRFRTDSMYTPGMLRRVLSGQRGLTTAVLFDREQNIWAGSDVGGLRRAREALFTVYTAADGLPSDVAEAVFTDHLDRVWVGGNCNGVAVQASGGFRLLSREDMPNDCVFSLAEDATGAMWMGTYGGGVGRWRDGMEGWYTTADGLPSNDVLALFLDRTGTLWAGTTEGVASWNGTRFVHHDLYEGAVQEDVRTIYQTRDGALWFGMKNGLIRYADGRGRLYTTREGLPNDFVRAIHEDIDGSLWLGTYGGGLARLRHDSVTTYTTADGLYDNLISSIIHDDRDNLWMSSNRGVFRVARTAFARYDRGDLPRLHSVVYDRADGMLSSETNGGFQPAVTQTADGRLWYPTIRGVAVIDARRAVANPVPPSVVLEEISVNGRASVPARTLTIGPGATDVEFVYSGVSFTAPDAVTFRYRLNGWDEDWVEAGTRRSAYYSRLPPGKYTFEIMAANRDGIWSPGAALVDVDVRPTLSQTWWFRTLLAIAVLLLAVTAFRRRLRQVERDAMAAEREAANRQVTSILESITNGFVALDRDWHFTYVNHTAETLLQQPRAELIGRSFWESLDRARGTVTETQLQAVMQKREPAAFEVPDAPSIGQWLEIHAYPADDGVSLYFSDITQRKLAEEVLRTQTLRDELTGVFNRRGLLAHAEQQALAAHRSGRGYDIVFIDMDGMKGINDSLGHAAGDTALCDTAELLRRTFRESDIIGRLGGDEFAVIVIDSAEPDTSVVVERLREHVARHNRTAGRPFDISLSIGVSRFNPLMPLNLDELLQLADLRMYDHKRSKAPVR